MGYPAQSFSGGVLEQGSILEGEAIPWYEFTHSEKIERVGFCTTDDGRIGCSPDGLLGADGGIECKCPEPHTHLRYLLGGVIPKEYIAQVQGALLVTQRKWWKFISYNRNFPPLQLTIWPDPAFQLALQSELDRFLVDASSAYDRLQAIIKAAHS
jgi:hypothetical protein